MSASSYYGEQQPGYQQVHPAQQPYLSPPAQEYQAPPLSTTASPYAPASLPQDPMYGQARYDYEHAEPNQQTQPQDEYNASSRNPYNQRRGSAHEYYSDHPNNNDGNNPIYQIGTDTSVDSQQQHLAPPLPGGQTEAAGSERGLAGGVMGGVAGLVAGHQVHHGLLGAIGGGIVGSLLEDQVQKHHQRHEDEDQGKYEHRHHHEHRHEHGHEHEHHRHRRHSSHSRHRSVSRNGVEYEVYREDYREESR